MDQGKTDPNNPNPIFPQQPVVAGAEPPAVPSTSTEGQNWGASATNQPSSIQSPGSASVAPSAPTDAVPQINTVVSPTSVAEAGSPTAFNPFATSATESAPSSVPVSTQESVPTDLTHLAGNSSGNSPEATNYVPQSDAFANVSGVKQPESLVVASSTSTEPAQAVTTEGSVGGFPKIIFVIGGLVLLIVIAASAYFIFGIGKPAEVPVENTSAPVVQQVPIVTPVPLIPISSPSASLPGSTSTSSGTSTSGNNSAYNLLRQRQASTSSAGQ